MDRNHKIAVVIFLLALLLAIIIFRGYWLAPRPIESETRSVNLGHADSYEGELKLHPEKAEDPVFMRKVREERAFLRKDPISPSSVKGYVPETEIEIKNPVNTGINLDWEESSRGGEHLRARKEREALQKKAVEASAEDRKAEDAKVAEMKKKEEVRRKKLNEETREAWRNQPVPPQISPPKK